MELALAEPEVRQLARHGGREGLGGARSGRRECLRRDAIPRPGGLVLGTGLLDRVARARRLELGQCRLPPLEELLESGGAMPPPDVGEPVEPLLDLVRPLWVGIERLGEPPHVSGDLVQADDELAQLVADGP